MLRKILMAALVAAALFVSSPAAEARGCWTPSIGGFNGPQVCVIDDDILK